MQLDIAQYKFEDSLTLDIYDTVNVPRSGEIKKFDATVTYMSPKLPAFEKRLKEEYEHFGKDVHYRVVAACAAATGWSGITENGKPVEFSIDSVRRVLGDPNNRWIVDQHYLVIDKQASFLASASES